MQPSSRFAVNVPKNRDKKRVVKLINIQGTYQAFTRMRTSPSPIVGSGFFKILTVFRPPNPVRTTARISLGGGVSFSFSSVAFSGVSSGGVSVVPFSVGVFSGAAAAGVSLLSVMMSRVGVGAVRVTDSVRMGVQKAGRRDDASRNE